MITGHTEGLLWLIKTALRAFGSMDTGLFTFSCMNSRGHVPCLVLIISPPGILLRHHILGHCQTSQAVAKDSCLDLPPACFAQEIHRPLATVPPFLQTHRGFPRQSTLLGEHVSPLASLILDWTSRHRHNTDTLVISLITPLSTSLTAEQGQSHPECFDLAAVLRFFHQALALSEDCLQSCSLFKSPTVKEREFTLSSALF